MEAVGVDQNVPCADGFSRGGGAGKAMTGKANNEKINLFLNHFCHFFFNPQ